jgi:hypothetical protein
MKTADNKVADIEDATDEELNSVEGHKLRIRAGTKKQVSAKRIGI